MKVILLKFIDRLGRQGETKNVADGYALNYLLPGKLAVVFTPVNEKKYGKQTQGQAEAKVQTAQNKKPQDLANRLRAVVLTFAEKADDSGTLFAGITKEKLIKALKAEGIVLKPKQIELSEAIKKTGEYKILVMVATSLKSEFRVNVQKAN